MDATGVYFRPTFRGVDKEKLDEQEEGKIISKDVCSRCGLLLHHFPVDAGEMMNRRTAPRTEVT